MIRRCIKLLAAYVVATIVAQGAATAEDVTWKFSDWVPPVHPLHKAFVAWGESVTKESGGTIKFTYFPSGQLGKPSDQYDMTESGIAQVAWINPGFHPGRWPVAALPEQPLILGDPIGASRALTSWYAEYAPKEMSEVKVCLMHTMIPQTIYSTQKAIETPDDLKGVKMRPSNTTQARIFKSAGAVTVFSPFPEIRDTFERGLATASTGVAGSLIVFGGAEATKYVMDAPLFGGVWTIAINKTAYGRLDAKQKAVIDSHCTPEWAARIAGPVAKFDRDGEAKLRNMGKIFVPVTAADKAAWRKLAAPALDDWKASVKKRGVDADAVLKSLTAKLQAENALVD
jgi:TRAP-type C4-dicarboxylate transport system substrate-binding protein